MANIFDAVTGNLTEEEKYNLSLFNQKYGGRGTSGTLDFYKDAGKGFFRNLPSVRAIQDNDISFGLDDITKNIKSDFGLSSIMNMYSIPKTMVDAQFGVSSSYASPQMEEELRKQIMSDIRRKGTTSGGISYKDLGFDVMYNSTGEHIDVSKNPGFRHPLGINSPQQAIGLTGGKMDYSVDPLTGKVTFTGGTDYNFGAGANQFGDVEWNPNLSVDPSLEKKEIDAFSPYERYRQGQIQIQKPIDVIRGSEEHYKNKFQEDKVPYNVIDDPWKQTTEPTIFKPVPIPTPPPQLPPTPTQRNVTKFSPTRSTAIKGGRGGRGNVGGNSMKAGSSRNYGVTGRRIVGGR